MSVTPSVKQVPADVGMLNHPLQVLSPSKQ